MVDSINHGKNFKKKTKAIFQKQTNKNRIMRIELKKKKKIYIYIYICSKFFEQKIKGYHAQRAPLVSICIDVFVFPILVVTATDNGFDGVMFGPHYRSSVRVHNAQT
mmetsp:Transcript_4397/g.6965  ORF Transcript_4397/g.6965 Transcript_4397/m.6965 type:complete len:107 (+) Transcript_4397:116-436(+)